MINDAKEYKCKTAFCTPLGLYEFNRMPFELRTALNSFHRAMNLVLGTLKNYACVVTPVWLRLCGVRLCGVLVVGKTEDEHLCDLDEVLHRLQEAGFRLSQEKCRFELSKISYLGHDISPVGIQPLPQRTAMVSKYPTPSCLKQVQAFLGMASYLRKFYSSLCFYRSSLERSFSKGSVV